jgi:ATP-binding cassette subfamily C protein CydC
MRALFRIVALWRDHALWLALGFAATLAALLAGVGLMTLSGTMLGAAAAGGLVAPILLRRLGVSRVVLRYFERLWLHEGTFRALAALRVWFFRGLARNAAGGLGFRRTGDILTRLVSDVEALDSLFIGIVVPAACAVLLLPLLLVLIGRRDPVLAVVIVSLFAAAAFGLPWAAMRLTRSAGQQLASAVGGLRVSALDALTGLREVRAFGAEGRMLAAVQAREGVLFAAQRRIADRTALAGVAAFLCGQLAIGAVLAAAGAEPVAAVAAAFLVLAAFDAVAGLPRAGALAGYAMVAARRVVEAAEAPPPVADPPQPAPTPAGAGLRFEALHFGWDPARPPVFDGLTLDVPEGSRVAILGPSGSGKSTLAALALKVAAPQQGRVLLGGVELATLAAADVRARIGWLSQATHLFDDTIRANLLLARPNADDAALWAALDAARIGEVVRALPDGLDTWVGEGGARFSGGQGRRLALARALLSNARVLILDEPCAGLDGETERAFLGTLNEVAEGRTVILILHRLSGVERLDRIWRISGGHAVAAAG